MHISNQRVQIKKGLKNVFGSLHGKKKIENQNGAIYCLAHFFLYHLPISAPTRSTEATCELFRKWYAKVSSKQFFFFIISPTLFKEDGSAPHTHANTLFKWWFEYSCFDLAGEILQSGECVF